MEARRLRHIPLYTVTATSLAQFVLSTLISCHLSAANLSLKAKILPQVYCSIYLAVVSHFKILISNIVFSCSPMWCWHSRISVNISREMYFTCLFFFEETFLPIKLKEIKKGADLDTVSQIHTTVDDNWIHYILCTNIYNMLKQNIMLFSCILTQNDIILIL